MAGEKTPRMMEIWAAWRRATGEEIERIVLQLFKMDATLVNQLKEILK